jgi:hypothetical protein
MRKMITTQAIALATIKRFLSLRLEGPAGSDGQASASPALADGSAPAIRESVPPPAFVVSSVLRNVAVIKNACNALKRLFAHKQNGQR